MADRKPYYNPRGRAKKVEGSEPKDEKKPGIPNISDLQVPLTRPPQRPPGPPTLSKELQINKTIPDNQKPGPSNQKDEPPSSSSPTKRPTPSKTIPEAKKQKTDEEHQDKAETSKPSKSETDKTPCVASPPEDEEKFVNYFKVLRLLDITTEKLRKYYAEVICAIPVANYVHKKSKEDDLAHWAKEIQIAYRSRERLIESIPEEDRTDAMKKFIELEYMYTDCKDIQEIRNQIAHKPIMKLRDEKCQEYCETLKPILESLGVEEEILEKIINENIEINSLDFENFQQIMFKGNKAMNEEKHNDALRYYQQALYISEENPTEIPKHCKAKALENCSIASGFVGCAKLSNAYKKCYDEYLLRKLENETETETKTKTEAKKKNTKENKTETKEKNQAKPGTSSQELLMNALMKKLP